MFIIFLTVKIIYAYYRDKNIECGMITVEILSLFAMRVCVCTRTHKCICISIKMNSNYYHVRSWERIRNRLFYFSLFLFFEGLNLGLTHARKTFYPWATSPAQEYILEDCLYFKQILQSNFGLLHIDSVLVRLQSFSCGFEDFILPKNLMLINVTLKIVFHTHWRETWK